MLDDKAKVAIPRTVWALGFVSLFMDLSSELVHSLLPVYLVSTLGASVLMVGLIEGVAEGSALIVKVFSGSISDFVGRRKGLILLGYGLASLSKPLFPLASSVETVFAARLLDRIGKGIRGAPRDAMIADVAPPAIRGACFGLRQSMDTIGAFLGPLLAMVLMYLLGNDIKTVLWFAVAPAFIAVLLIVVGVSEPNVKSASARVRPPLRFSTLKRFSKNYWWVVAVGAIFTLARFSEGFLVLRAQQVGFAITWIPLVMVVMSLVYALSAYPAGSLSDRIDRKPMLIVGLVLLVLADLALARTESVVGVLIGVALWGMHMGFTQGIFAAMIADSTPSELKGTAFGLFNLVGGLCTLLASVIAGGLWQGYGAAMTFYAGGALSIVALAMLLFRRSPESGRRSRTRKGR